MKSYERPYSRFQCELSNLTVRAKIHLLRGIARQPGQIPEQIPLRPVFPGHADPLPSATGGQCCQDQCRRAQSVFSHLQGERAV